MDALILAAGRGSRLGHGVPKCLVDIGGRRLIDRQLEALAWAGVDRVVVVAGYQAAMVAAAVPPTVTLLHNPRYAETNSLYSFWLAREDVGDELLVLNADVLFHPLIARALVRWRGSALAYDSASGSDEEEMKVAVHGGGLVAMSKTLPPDAVSGENVGIIRLSGVAVDAAFTTAGRVVEAGGEQSWLATAISELAAAHHLQCLDVSGMPWVEIDFPEDLDHARDHVLPAVATPPLHLARAA